MHALIHTTQDKEMGYSGYSGLFSLKMLGVLYANIHPSLFIKECKKTIAGMNCCKVESDNENT